MIRPTPPPSELHELFSAMIDDTLTGDERDQLAQMLRDDPAVRAAYHAFIEIESRLVFAHVPAPSLPDLDALAASPTLAGLRARWGKVRRWLDTVLPQAIAPVLHPVRFYSLVSVVTVLFWLSIIAVLWRPTPTIFDNVAGETKPNVPPIVGSITDSIDARWNEEAAPPIDRAHLLAGTSLELLSGLVELTLRDGAVVVLQGPATFTATGANSIGLARGTLTAQVPESAHGFQVETATTTIIDLGTEFGVHVETSGENEFRVFDGEVELIAAGESQRARLSRGQAARVDANGRLIRGGEKTRHRFVRGAEFRRRSARLPVRVVRYEYTGDVQPSPEPGRNDPGRTVLIDGPPKWSSYNSGEWVGVIDPVWNQHRKDNGAPQPQVDFVLATETAGAALCEVRIVYLVDHEGAVAAPNEVRVTMSDDATFDAADPVVSSTAFDDTADHPEISVGAIRTLKLNLGETPARHVRLEFLNADEWTFLGEVQFFARPPMEETTSATDAPAENVETLPNSKTP